MQVSQCSSKCGCTCACSCTCAMCMQLSIGEFVSIKFLLKSSSRHEFHKGCIDPWLLEHRTCPMCKLDVLRYYGYVVGAQNQIINLNGFILGVQASNESPSSDNIQTPSASIANIINQNENQNHPTIHTMATNSINNTNDNDIRTEPLSIMLSNQILAITPTSQSLNIRNFNSNSIHNDHSDVEVRSSCSFNRCNSRLSSAIDTDNPLLSNSNCSDLLSCNANVCTFRSFIDNTSHPNRNAKSNNSNDSSGSRRVSDV